MLIAIQNAMAKIADGLLIAVWVIGFLKAINLELRYICYYN
jgi:hypothetical protein